MIAQHEVVDSHPVGVGLAHVEAQRVVACLHRFLHHEPLRSLVGRVASGLFVVESQGHSADLEVGLILPCGLNGGLQRVATGAQRECLAHAAVGLSRCVDPPLGVRPVEAIVLSPNVVVQGPVARQLPAVGFPLVERAVRQRHAHGLAGCCLSEVFVLGAGVEELQVVESHPAGGRRLQAHAVGQRAVGHLHLQQIALRHPVGRCQFHALLAGPERGPLNSKVGIVLPAGNERCAQVVFSVGQFGDGLLHVRVVETA